MTYAKPSDNPLSPFNPNFKSDIDWSDMRRSSMNSEAMTRHVNKQRKAGKEVGTLHGLPREAPKSLIDPKRFHVDMSVFEKKAKKK